MTEDRFRRIPCAVVALTAGDVAVVQVSGTTVPYTTVAQSRLPELTVRQFRRGAMAVFFAHANIAATDGEKLLLKEPFEAQPAIDPRDDLARQFNGGTLMGPAERGQWHADHRLDITVAAVTYNIAHGDDRAAAQTAISDLDALKVLTCLSSGAVDDSASLPVPDAEPVLARLGRHMQAVRVGGRWEITPAGRAALRDLEDLARDSGTLDLLTDSCLLIIEGYADDGVCYRIQRDVPEDLLTVARELVAATVELT
jgi:hypothetical protein